MMCCQDGDRRLQALVIGLLVSSTGCAGGSDSLAPWSGSWRAIETYMRGAAFTPVAEAIHELRPEYTAAEIQDLFASAHDVDFTELELEGSTLTFVADGEVLCSGSYRGHRIEAAEDEHDHGDGMQLELEASLEGSCEPGYADVVLESLPIEGVGAGELYLHFHLLAGPARDEPWSPGVIEPVSDAFFTEAQLERASYYAAALPER